MRLVSNPYRLIRRSALVLAFALVILMGQMVAQAGWGSDAPTFGGPLNLQTMGYGEQAFDGVPMVHVPAGCFDSGDPEAQNNSFGNIEALPEHHCFSEGYWIDKDDVTNADFMHLGGQAAVPSDSQHPKQPRVHITWYEADAFCRLRGGALPTPIEWEYAARGPKNNLYPNGNELKPETFAGFRPDGTDGVVADVDTHPASASWVGAQDMIGNVWEWTSGRPKTNWRNSSIDIGNLRDDTTLRIIRGGAVSFPGLFEYLGYRSAFQWLADASNEAWDTGFRCVRSESPGAATSEPGATQTMPPASTPSPAATASPLTSDPNAPLIPAGTSNSTWTPIEKQIGGFSMDYVPAGCFNMGTDNPTDPGLQNESPLHRVCLTAPYWIDKDLVTNAQYKRLMGAALSILADVSLPVSPVSWTEADAFCKLRGGQLPTEAQWEYAARGPQSLVYPWGNDFDSSIVGDPASTFWNVGANPQDRSWVGALDLTENAMQWVADWYAATTYQGSVTNDPQGPTSGTYRVLRGASFRRSCEIQTRAANRDFNRPDTPVADTSIRCILPFNPKMSLTVTATMAPLVTVPALTPAPSLPALIPAGTANALWTPVSALFRGVPMQRVPAGCFFMGQRDDEPGQKMPNNEPKHLVCLTRPFWIDQTEVSNDTFTRLSGRALIDTQFLGMQRPRTQISWAEAQAFCSARGGSLPTEAQWEYAARGPQSLVFPWGDNDDPDKVVSYNGNFDMSSPGYFVSRPANVGSKPAGMSWVGALDMSGNVAEWVKDWYVEYDENAVIASPQNDPTDPASGTEHGWRGGDFQPVWPDSTDNPAWRDGNGQGVEIQRADWLGVRCILPDSAKPDATLLPSATR